ncbi:MAG: sigma-70 family polymerase sigma factor, partial [Solirubrobacterales bacterium]|nr:sigma-70 family polymerase sigma factor [Solirubrobacterales bacterium]
MALLDELRTPAPARRWSSAPDAALVRGATAGHDGAFAEIFARYHAPLVRYCRGILLDDDVAQDAAQNALASALRALSAGRSLPQSLGPWLYRIAQREAVDLARSRRRDAARRAADTEGAELLANIPAPADERARDRLRELLGDLSRLPLRQRSALLLRELSGLEYAEIAVALDSTPAAARQSVCEARQALVQSGSGRQDSCSAVRELVDGGDRRRLRARRVRAHLDDCLGCQAFAAKITDRRRDLALLFPLHPAAIASAGGALATLGGGGAAAGGGAVAASGWSFGLGGLGASGAAKCAAVCATAAIVGVGSLAEKAAHPSRPAAPVTVIAQVPQPGGATAG